MSSINHRYKTAIKDLPLRTSNGRKRGISNSSLQIQNKTYTEEKVGKTTNEEIRSKLNSLSDKELESVYITCLILLYDTLMETKNKK